MCSSDLSNQGKKKKGPRRFYRDPENAVLGGICGGIAAQFNWDVTIVRIALIALTLLTGFFGGGWFFILAYILTWIIAPKALTVSQRLEMQGEEVTVENIKAEFDNFKNYVESENFKSASRTLGQRLGGIIGWVLKIFGGFIGAVLAFAGFAVLIALFASLFVAIFLPATFVGFVPEFMLDGAMLTPERSGKLLISLLLVVGCPIFLLIYSLVRLASGHKSKSRTTFWVTLVLWLSGLFMLISTTARTAINWKNHTGKNHSIYWNNTNSYVDQVRYLEGAFKAVDVVGNIKLEINNSPNQLLAISAPEDFMHHVITEVKNETLYVYSDGFLINKQIKLSLSANQLESIVAKGAAKIKSNSSIESNNLYIMLQGAAKADLEVDIKNEFEIEIEGSSSIDLDGSCDKLKLRALGASKIAAKDLKSRCADVYIAGASSAKLYASDSLTANAYGTARIVCYGNPTTVNKSDRIGTNIRIQ